MNQGVITIKTAKTKEIESALARELDAMDVYGCKEVTLRNPNYEANKERVDYVTFNTKGIIRCYEIKVTESDLNSKNKLSFWGDYNYLVLPKDLYNNLKAKTENEERELGSKHISRFDYILFSNTGIITYDFDYHHFKHEKNASKCTISIASKVAVIESFARSASKQLMRTYY